VLIAIASLPMCGALSAAAQGSHAEIELHASSNVSASTIGLPEFPGARARSDGENDSTADLGLTFGNVHFRLLVSHYTTSASPSRVLDFYRTPLSRYGDVLECEGGRAVGSLTRTSSGLTCADDQHGGTTGNDGSARQLEAGTPERFRIVAVEPSNEGPTRFTLLFMEVPTGKGASGR
jgi:hypothetical protein